MRRSKNSPEPQERGNFTPPSRGAAAPAPAPVPGADAAPTGSGSKFSPRNWRVPTRLNAILLIPVIVAIVMGTFQVKGSIDTWSEAEDAEKTALIVRAAENYGQALLNERDLSAAPLLSGKGTNGTVDKARDATDAAKAAFDEAVADMPEKQGLERRLALFKENESKLTALRKAAYTRAMDPVKTEEGYVTVQHSLMEFANELGLGTGNITSYGRTVYAVSLAKAAVSLQRSIGTHLIVRPSSERATLEAQSTAFSSYAYLENIAIGEYVSAGTEQDYEDLKSVLRGKQDEGKKKLAAAAKEARANGQEFTPPPSPEKMIKLIGSGARPSTLRAQGVTPEAWFAVTTAKFDGYREIETQLIDKAVAESAAIADDAERDAYINGAIVVAAVLAAFIIAGMMARQMSRSMRQLRTAAFGIAEQRLPMLVDQLSRTDPGRVDTRVQPIPINTQDEIGEVARAFDQVHREAVRLAAEQALLRGNVNAIFTNLSRRNQSLIEGQLTLITDLENNEADPDQLENLFRLDHLATRMRRNGENLLVLAGEEPGRRWDQPVPLVDVLRAASSEVEQYERIELSGVPEAEIHGRAVTDLVHLLAELLENATTFSSPQTKVRVTATRLPDGRVMIEIHDKGIGLTAEDFADINHKLANPPTVDAAISQRMGLFVVGRLSDRHHIRVQLRPSGEQAGTTSLVMLPDAITHGGSGADLPESEFTVSRIVPEQQQAPAYEAPPLRTAAELGFDDSRYDEGDASLDPVGRSLLREERRAALESQGERPLYRDEVSPHPYDQGDQGGREQSYEQQGTYDGQQAAYEHQGGYEQGYEQQDPYAQQGGYEQGYAAQGGGYDGYPESAYPESGFDGQGTPQDPAQDAYANYNGQPQQGGWQQQGPATDAFGNSYEPEPESAPSAPQADRERVGFDRQGPAPSSAHELTDAGLPRRGSTPASNGHRNATGDVWTPGPVQDTTAPSPQAENAPAGADGSGAGDDDWRSANDERWQRAEQLRQPRAGGVTSSGLPRRVPKANLVEGTAEQTPQGGPQVSRAPEDVRGRLSNLRRGVQRGRDAGSDDSNGQGLGPGGNYNQER
ncbi:nitrate- and nitrite sensing domain-containing protein [Streptomyces sp. LHD-70]|uniref:nitrate- and nitrite sensing domain-containing protein n=1 Tax=Streptomyces sp. LHD-70 TaxID=3072140 RepID=UPI00280DF414|nr:nitrate- and nitrite sensing domain-containing protein [Streptomyces sp. LHD-70]MDQ8701904.1 nitrate- and nitrite sensing domain-containing protein [Streptomyces sp. LHD-70]